MTLKEYPGALWLCFRYQYRWPVVRDELLEICDALRLCCGYVFTGACTFIIILLSPLWISAKIIWEFLILPFVVPFKATDKGLQEMRQMLDLKRPDL